MRVEEIYALPVNEYGWRILPNGTCVKLGDGVTLDNRVVWDRSPLAVQGSRHVAVNVGPGMIQIGCQEHSFEHWRKQVLAIARQHGYTKEQAEEYQKIVEFIAANGIAERVGDREGRAAMKTIPFIAKPHEEV